MTLEPGRFYTTLLTQTQLWVGIDGIPRHLVDLDTDHLRNLEPFMHRKGEHLRWKWLEYQCRIHRATGQEVIGVIDGKDILGREVLLWSDDGGNLDDAFDEYIDFEMDRPFQDWFDDLSLIKRIRELVAERT